MLNRPGSVRAVLPSPDEVRAAVRDRAALERVLCAVRPLVLSYCRTRVAGLGPVTAEDVAQDVLIAVCTALPTYRPHRPFLAFVYGIARNKVADAYRAAARRPVEPVAEVPEWPSLDDSPERRAIRREESEQLAALLRQVSPRQREVLLLRQGLGFSADEVAELLGSSPNTVRVCQARALSRLRATLRKDQP